MKAKGKIFYQRQMLFVFFCKLELKTFEMVTKSWYFLSNFVQAFLVLLLPLGEMQYKVSAMSVSRGQFCWGFFSHSSSQPYFKALCQEFPTKQLGCKAFLMPYLQPVIIPLYWLQRRNLFPLLYRDAVCRDRRRVGVSLFFHCCQPVHYLGSAEWGSCTAYLVK